MELNNSSSDVDTNIGSGTEQLKVNDLGDGNVPDVGSDIGSPIEHLKVDASINLGDGNVPMSVLTSALFGEKVKVDGCINLGDCDVPTSLRCLVSRTKRQRRQISSARRKASVVSQVMLASSCIHSLPD